MKIILEESQRLAMYRDRISESGRRISKRNSKRSDEVDISLTSLPDLSSGLTGALARQTSESNSTADPHFIKRVSSGDSGAALLAPKQQPPVLVRALSQRPMKSNLDSLGVGLLRPVTQPTASTPLEPSGTPSTASTRPVAGQPRSQEPVSPTDEAPSNLRTTIPSDDVVSESNRWPSTIKEDRATDSKTWQASLKKMLDEGRQKEQSAPPALQDAAIPKRRANGETERQDVVRKKEKATGTPTSSTSSSR